MAARRHTHHSDRPALPAPLGQHGNDGPQQLPRGWRVLAQQLPQTRPPPEVREPGQGSSLTHRLVGRDPALDRHTQPVHAGRPLCARLDRHADPIQPCPCRTDHLVRDVGREPRPRAVVAPPTRRRRLVVKGPLEEGHSALAARFVVEHELLLGLAGCGHPLVALAVIDPRNPGAHPPARDAVDRAVDVEHLEEQLQSGPPDVDDRLESSRRQRTTGLGQSSQHSRGLVLARHRYRGEVGPDVLVLDPGQQEDVGALGRTTGTTDLLVVRHR